MSSEKEIIILKKKIVLYTKSVRFNVLIFDLFYFFALGLLYFFYYYDLSVGTYTLTHSEQKTLTILLVKALSFHVKWENINYIATHFSIYNT